MSINWINKLDSALDPSLKGIVKVIVLDQCQSTMKSVKELFHSGVVAEGEPLFDVDRASYLWCFALSQSKGVGRQQKEWVSSSRDGMYLSILASEPISYQDLSGLSLVVGTSIVNVLNRYRLNAGLKWPNDILISGRKICGVLIETFSASESSSMCHVIMGIGLNINQKSFPAGLNATSMVTELGGLLDYEEVCLAVANQVTLDFLKFRAEGFGAFIEFWRAKSIMGGAIVRNKDGLVLGSVVDIDDDGFLLIQGEVDTVRILNIDEGLKFEFQDAIF